MFAAETGNDAVIRRDDGAGDFALRLLQIENLFLDRIAGDEAIGEHMMRLSDTMAAACVRKTAAVPSKPA